MKTLIDSSSSAELAQPSAPSPDAASHRLLDALKHEIELALAVAPGTFVDTGGRTLQECGLSSMGALRVQFRLQQQFDVLPGLAELLGTRDLAAFAGSLTDELDTGDALDTTDVATTERSPKT